MYQVWQPKYGVMTVIMVAILLALAVAALFSFSVHAYGQEPVAQAGSVPLPDQGSDINWFDVALKLLPLVLAQLSPYITMGVTWMVSKSVGVIPQVFLAPMNLLFGTLAAAFSAAVTDSIPVDVAAGSGAVLSGVSWRLKQSEPVHGAKSHPV